MAIEITPDGTTVITGPEDTNAYRLLAARRALKLEIETGMKMSRGVSILKLVNAEMGTNFRNKRAAYEAFNKYLVDKYPGRMQHVALREAKPRG